MNFKDLKRSYIESDPTSDAALNTKLLDSIGFECIEKRSPKTISQPIQLQSHTRKRN